MEALALPVKLLRIVDSGFLGVTCSPMHSVNMYVAASQAKGMFWLLKTFYFPIFTCLSKC